MDPYYRRDLALVHARGFGAHADGCAPGLVALLEPVLGGLVLEIGAGSGRLTRHLVDAGHRVLATDASPAMLDLARDAVPDAEGQLLLTLPDDPLPAADAVVSVGHALSYLPDEAAVTRGLQALAGALRPGGIMAVDLCDLRWGQVRRGQPATGRTGADWAVLTEASMPAPGRYVRDITTFLRNDDGSWRRDDERHTNVLVDTAAVPPLLARHGVQARVQTRLGDYPLPEGLVAIVGRRPPGATTDV